MNKLVFISLAATTRINFTDIRKKTQLDLCSFSCGGDDDDRTSCYSIDLNLKRAERLVRLAW